MDLQKYKDELAEIEDFLAKPDAYNSPDFAAQAKRASLLREILDLDAKIRKSEVREVAVTGKADSRKGEKLVVFYAPEDLDPAQVIEEMRTFDLPNIWLPKADDFIKVDELPLLGSGKLDLRRLKEMADAL